MISVTIVFQLNFKMGIPNVFYLYPQLLLIIVLIIYGYSFDIMKTLGEKLIPTTKLNNKRGVTKIWRDKDKSGN